MHHTHETMQLQYLCKNMVIIKTVWKLKILKPQQLSISVWNLKTSTTVYLSPMNWERVYPTGYPPFLLRHALMPTPSQFGSVVVPCVSGEGKKPLFCQQQGSLFNCLEVFHIKVDDNRSLKNLTCRGAYPFHTPNGLAIMTQFCK